MSITREQLEKVARLLGKSGIEVSSPVGFPTTWFVSDGFMSGKYWSDGDLLLCILNRAAEIRVPDPMSSGGKRPKYWPRLSYQSPHAGWACEMVTLGGEDQSHYGATPLEAAILAFVQLPESHA